MPLATMRTSTSSGRGSVSSSASTTKGAARSATTAAVICILLSLSRARLSHSLPRLHRTRVYPSSAVTRCPKSETSDFGWRVGRGVLHNAARRVLLRPPPPDPSPPLRGGGERERGAHTHFANGAIRSPSLY